MRIEVKIERDFIPSSDCPFSNAEDRATYDDAYLAAWKYVADNSHYEITGDGGAESRGGQFSRGDAGELGFTSECEIAGFESGTSTAKDCYFRLVREGITEFFAN